MQRVNANLESGAIDPITPVKFFEAKSIEQCFRYFQKGEHMGKVVVSIPSSLDELDIQPSRDSELALDGDACYLLAGGLGGLGRAVSIWLAEHGAKHLVFISRSGGRSADMEAFSEELKELGCTFEVFTGSVADARFVASVVRSLQKPIRGVLQFAMELHVRIPALSALLELSLIERTGSAFY
jgi:hypothetical protein